MTDPHSALREHLLDGAKAAPAVTFWTTWFWGVNWGVIGAFLMVCYTTLLIMDKLGLLAPLRAFGARLIARLHSPPASPPAGVRSPRDE